jgi:thiol-disulfide isomerase/thioredoxin
MSFRVTYIGATWCKVCFVVKPMIEMVTNKFNVELTVMDADDNGVEVTRVPTVRVYKDDVLVKEIVTMHVDTLRKELEAGVGLAISEDF